jgi:4-carboxymuconolactone decarboxylase
MKILLSLILGVFCMAGFQASAAVNDGMIVRIAKIEVEPNSLDEYLVFLKENGEASQEKEKGVI